MISCRICNHVNPAAAARCEKCDTWLAQAADVGLKAQIAPDGPPRLVSESLHNPEFVEELRALLRDGRKIDAIARFREATGHGLRESKAIIEALEAGKLTSPATVAVDGRVDEAKIVALLRENQFIQAIKAYREATGLGLKESKQAVEAIAARYGIRPTQKGCFGVVLLATLSPPALWGAAKMLAPLLA